MNQKKNIVLFPGTLQSYQNTLTTLLETEQYDEALKLLHYLLLCEGEDKDTYEEWELLLEWLTTHTASLQQDQKADGEEWDEKKIINEQIQTKLLEDEDYTDKLLEMLMNESSLEKKWLALDQLVHIDDSQMNEKIIKWFQNENLNPMLQFKALQTLKQREAKGEVSFNKLGERLKVNIENTPIHFEDFPNIIVDVIHIVREITENNDPIVSAFAEQTWKEFLSYIYGTKSYSEITQHQNSAPCAYALHKISLEMTIGNIDEELLIQSYDLKKDDVIMMEKTYKKMKSYIETVLQIY
ncbi:hypothetical protein [Chengkuizengella sediminis]|uniref:hypothetical protein n=1 Tax=Chengkuizengella sediminis TaxID=1885917 RepID=UPI00138A6C74|nr:hypothetical protein [Chengkuizengella sediminis]NDI36724.1 hypothetical protein [Chengkuizengella sediminis]